MKLDPNFSEFIALLNASTIEYLLVGGYAVVFHLDDLKTNKRTTGRFKDLNDTEHLP